MAMVAVDRICMAIPLHRPWKQDALYFIIHHFVGYYYLYPAYPPPPIWIMDTPYIYKCPVHEIKLFL